MDSYCHIFVAGFPCQSVAYSDQIGESEVCNTPARHLKTTCPAVIPIVLETLQSRTISPFHPSPRQVGMISRPYFVPAVSYSAIPLYTSEDPHITPSATLPSSMSSKVPSLPTIRYDSTACIDDGTAIGYPLHQLLNFWTSGHSRCCRHHVHHYSFGATASMRTPEH